MLSIFDQEPVANKFTFQMREKIRNAREEAGLSQADLAKKIYRRRATVSDIESGKSELGTITLSRFSFVLDKPVSYFFPDFAIRKINQDELSSLAQELLLFFDLINDGNLKSIALKQIKDLADYKPD